MTAAEFIAQMKSIISLAETGAGVAAAFDPEIALPLEAAEEIAPILEELAVAAVNGWSSATGTPITVESITALLPNPNPLPLPTE